MKNKENRQHSLPEEAERYYEMGLEVGRLSGAGGELEFIRTKEIISRYLPEPPAVVLDVGGGPGSYACWLAKEGYIEIPPASKTTSPPHSFIIRLSYRKRCERQGSLSRPFWPSRVLLSSYKTWMSSGVIPNAGSEHLTQYAGWKMSPQLSV
jgi:hypothetical protein